MGGVVTASGAPGPEIDSRCSQLGETINSIRKSVLAHRQLPDAKRVGLYNSLGIAKQLYAGHVWGPLTQPNVTRLQSNLM
eukprot:13424232-Alexandrium_andersonii.AAC.1